MMKIGSPSQRSKSRPKVHQGERSKPMRTKVHRGEVMELFRAEKIGELESNSTRQCRVCGKTLKIVRTVFYPDTKEAVRVFECKCGERTWDD